MTGLGKKSKASVKAPKKKRRIVTPITLLQTAFLTAKFFLKNRLISYAGACSFSFLFSFVPVCMMITIVLLRILHASPETVKAILNALPEMTSYVSADSAIKIAQSMQTVTSFEIVLGFFIFWMARRFFATIFDSMQCIFHIGQKRRALIRQVLTLAVEVVVIVVVATVIFAYLSLRAAVHMPSLSDLSSIPVIGGFISKQYFVQLPNLLLLVLIAIVYRIASGTKPRLWLCLLSAALCTVVFWVFRNIMHLFLNTANYNLIYGVLGQLIVTLLDIFFFFIFFLVFAEFIFVVQFLDNLLLAELYLLPSKEKTRTNMPQMEQLRYELFIRQDSWLAKDANAIRFKKGDVIYKQGDTESGAYYIATGYIQLKRGDNDVRTYKPGEFFGEVSCIIDKPRSTLATAVTDANVVHIDGNTFRALLQQNPEAAHKAIGQISSYVAKVYGRNDAFSI